MGVEKKELVCIMCPRGCNIVATLDDGIVVEVKGPRCSFGDRYAREELTAPKRMLTATVRIIGGRLPLLPVVSAAVLPKERVLDCAAVLRAVEVAAPVQAGDVIVRDILGLGVDIVASRDMEQV